MLLPIPALAKEAEAPLVDSATLAKSALRTPDNAELRIVSYILIGAVVVLSYALLLAATSIASFVESQEFATHALPNQLYQTLPI